MKSTLNTPSLVRQMVSMSMQPALIDAHGYKVCVAKTAIILHESGVTERRLTNAIGKAGMSADIADALRACQALA